MELTDQPQYALCSVRRHPKRLGLDTCAAYKAIVSIMIFASECTPSLKLRVVFCVFHFSCTADTDRQTIAAEEGLTELCANVYSLPGIYDMTNIETRALQVIVIFFVEDELYNWYFFQHLEV